VPLKRHQSFRASAVSSGPLSVADVGGCAASPLDDLFEHADGVVRGDPAGCRGGECLAGVLVGDGQDLDRPAVGCLV
jgi:hypothetical protein